MRIGERHERWGRTGGFLARALVAVVVAVACGGQSIRRVGDDDTTDDDEPPIARGGSANGGRGGTAPNGGVSGSFTGGKSAGGNFTGGTAGTVAVGGTGFGGTGFGGTGFGGTGVAGAAGSSTCDFPRRPGPRGELNWTSNALILPSTNQHDMLGGWFTYDDCESARPLNLRCTEREPSLVGPDGALGWASSEGIVCASGVAPRVDLAPDGSYAYSYQWGFGLGFSLNQGSPYDAASRCIQGFQFDLDGSAPATIRMNVVTAETYNVPHFVESPLGPGVRLLFADAQQGGWVVNRVPLDTSRITYVQFHVFTNAASETPFAFCVLNARVLD